MNWLIRHYKGLLLCTLLSAMALVLSQHSFAHQHGVSALTLAILLGMLVGNTLYPKLAGYCQLGVNFSKGNLLRLGIILYGFRLTFQQIIDIGVSSLLIDIFIVASTFTLGSWLGRKWLKIHPHTTMLVASGASICGAAAVLATAPVIKSKSNHISVAVATVVIFGTLGMFLYPWLYQFIEPFFTINDKNFGVYIGSTVHEVAQVVAAGNAISTQAANSAVITKMVRVMLLAPFLLWLSIALARRNQKQNQARKPIVIPYFAIGFVLVVVFNSLQLLPQSATNTLVQIDNILLTMAMSALGLTTHFSAIKQAGKKPLLLALILFLWLLLAGAIVNILIQSI